MAISRDEVEHVAALARLSLSEEEARRMTEELGSILEHMEVLAEVDLPRRDRHVSAASGEDVRGPTDEEPATDKEPATEVEPAPVPEEGEEEPDEEGDGADPLERPPEEWAPASREGFFIVPRLPALGGSEEGGAEA